jgi:hypothetical protein
VEALAFWGFDPVLFDRLKIEERETWTAESLRVLGFGRFRPFGFESRE